MVYRPEPGLPTYFYLEVAEPDDRPALAVSGKKIGGDFLVGRPSGSNVRGDLLPQEVESHLLGQAHDISRAEDVWRVSDEFHHRVGQGIVDEGI